uniref:TnpV protein n=1 Tax=Peptoniphilus equinus TaxID=3016343 RepID=UPI0036F23D1B
MRTMEDVKYEKEQYYVKYEGEETYQLMEQKPTESPLGRYAMMKRHYLLNVEDPKARQLLQELLEAGDLNRYLQSVHEQCKTVIDRLDDECRARGITSENLGYWECLQQKMQMLNTMEEMVLHDYVYNN